MERIKRVEFQLPNDGQHHILVHLTDGRRLKFHANRMYADMKRLGMMRLKVYIIHEKLYELAMQPGRRFLKPEKELLAEFRLAAERLGVEIVHGPPKKHRRRSRPKDGTNRESPPAE